MTPSQDGPKADSEGAGDLTSTIELLDRFKQGDERRSACWSSVPSAAEAVGERTASPVCAGLADTQDLVQDAVIRAFPQLKTFEARHPGALQAYLRQAITNHIRDEIRKVNSRPPIGGDSRTANSTPGRRRSNRRSAANGSSDTRPPSPGCALRIAKRSLPVSSCSKATKKWRSPSENRAPTPRGWR